MSVHVRLFSANGNFLEDSEFDIIEHPSNTAADVLEELMTFIELGVAWKITLDEATPHERSIWSRADTMARFRRAIKENRSIVFRGRIRLMTENRVARYEHVMRHFERPPYVVADDPRAALCLDIRIPTGH